MAKAESFTANSKTTRAMYHRQVDQWIDEHKYVTFPPPRFGLDRALTQSALFHVWLTEIAAFLTPCHKKEVTVGMVEGTKKTIKGMFYQHTQYEWMVHEVKCVITKREKKDYTSSASWKRGEMFEVLNFMQMWSATIGLVLESKGEHARLTKKQNG